MSSRRVEPKLVVGKEQPEKSEGDILSEVIPGLNVTPRYQSCPIKRSHPEHSSSCPFVSEVACFPPPGGARVAITS